MNMGKDIPYIRFRGFNGEWKEKVMLDCSSKIGDGLHGTPTYTDNTGVYFINGNNLVSGSIVITSSTKQVNREEQSKDDISLDSNTILLSINGTIGNLAWYQGQNVMLGKSVAFITLDNCDNRYMYTYLQTERVKNYFLNSLTGSTIKNLGLKAIRESIVLIPDEKEEQTQIGNYFQKLDSLINQHQQKHNKLSNIKKSMLAKMFPKAGKSLPEIRFEGINGDWETRPFSKSMSFIGTNTLSRADLNYEQGNAKNIHYGDILVKFGETLNIKSGTIPYITSNGISDKLNSRKLQDGDILFADAAEDESVGKCVEVQNVDTEIVFSGLHTIATRPEKNFAPSYLGYYFNSNSFHEQLLPLMQGTKVLSISKTSISTTSIKYPKSELEQEKVGNYFQKLDVLINQHQQQIIKLNNIKQACLNKMFV